MRYFSTRMLHDCKTYFVCRPKERRKISSDVPHKVSEKGNYSSGSRPTKHFGNLLLKTGRGKWRQEMSTASSHRMRLNALGLQSSTASRLVGFVVWEGMGTMCQTLCNTNEGNGQIFTLQPLEGSWHTYCRSWLRIVNQESCERQGEWCVSGRVRNEIAT